MRTGAYRDTLCAARLLLRSARATLDGQAEQAEALYEAAERMDDVVGSHPAARSLLSQPTEGEWTQAHSASPNRVTWVKPEANKLSSPSASPALRKECHMKIQIFSDLHFDAASGGWVPRLAPGADLIVCAGDVCEGLEKGFTFLRSFFPDTPIVTVAGNHSFYRRCHDEELAAGRQAAAADGITFLENDAAVIGGVRFIGATLWTDYELFGEAHRTAAMDAARRGLNDHRFITWRKQPWARFRPEEALHLHRRSRAYIAQNWLSHSTGRQSS